MFKKSSLPIGVGTALIALAVFAVFSPCLSAKFLNWDDQAYVLKYEPVQALTVANVRTMFTERILGVYTPLAALSFAVEKSSFGLNPFVYHLDNLLLHIAVTLLGFALALRLGLPVRAAFLAALLFGIHPMHVESVAWLTERKDVLYSVFYLVALLCWWRYLEARGSGHKAQGGIGISGAYAGALGLVLLSLLAKPMALSLPLIMFLVAWYREGRTCLKRWKVLVPFFCLTVSIVWLTYIEHVRNPLGPAVSSLLIWLWTLGFYLWKFALPVVAHPFYHLPEPVALTEWPYCATVVFLALAGGGLWRGRGDRLLVFAVGWFFASIFFLLRFDDADSYVVADRFMYLPSLGFCLWLGAQADRVLADAHRKRMAAIVVAACFILLAAKTTLQCYIWHDNETLWSYVIGRYPHKEIAYNNRAVAYAEEKRFDLAVRDLTDVLSFAKNKAMVFYNRGMTFLEWADGMGKAGRAAEARQLYQNALSDMTEAIRLDPSYAKSYFQRGRIRYQVGDFAVALQDLSEAIARDPGSRDAYNQRGSVYYALGDNPRALADYSRAVTIDPGSARGHSNRGAVLASLGKNSEALAEFGRALELDPDLSEAWYDRAVIRARTGDRAGALADADRAKALGAVLPANVFSGSSKRNSVR